MEKLYTLKETAVSSGFSEQHLRKLCATEKIAHTRKGSRYFFTAEEAAKLIVHYAPAVAAPAMAPVVEFPLDQNDGPKE